jgi:uncharacterized membrane-anchored protein
VADRGGAAPQPGWREVLLVAAGVVVVVLAAAVVTGFLPGAARDVVFRTPLAIGVLVLGTGWLLWRISRRDAGTPDR